MAMLTTADGVEIWYEEAGGGPPLVLVHGITESSEAWRPLIGDLATDHRVIALDLRGHGRSSRIPPYDPLGFANDVRQALDVLGVGDEVVLIGHSLGGVVVTAYATLFPCRAVINVDQPLELVGFQAGLQTLAPMLRGDEASFQQAVKLVFDSLRGRLSDAEEARLAGIRHPEQPVVLGVWEPVIDLPTADLEALVASLAEPVRVPYLALHGADPGDGYVDWLAARIPTSTYELWPDLGHYPHLVEPERFVARVRAFEAAVGAA